MKVEKKLQNIQWVEKKVRLSALRPYEKNPRTITEPQFERLKASLLADGYHSRIKATTDLRVMGGHQRIRAMKEIATELGIEGGMIPVLVPDREISDDQFKRILLTDNHSNGVFDMEMLANDFDLEFLQGVGLHEVTNIAPMGDEPEGGPAGGCVRCPQCSEEFPVKGNKVKQ